MVPPVVTEQALPVSAVEHDPFIDDLCRPPATPVATLPPAPPALRSAA